MKHQYFSNWSLSSMACCSEVMGKLKRCNQPFCQSEKLRIFLNEFRSCELPCNCSIMRHLEFWVLTRTTCCSQNNVRVFSQKISFFAKKNCAHSKLFLCWLPYCWITIELKFVHKRRFEIKINRSRTKYFWIAIRHAVAEQWSMWRLFSNGMLQSKSWA